MNDIRRWQSSLNGVAVSPNAFESGWMGEVDEQRELLTARTSCCEQASQLWFTFRCIFLKCFSMPKWIGKKLVERNLATLMKTRLRAPSPAIWRLRAEEFVHEDLASAHCWRTFVHFQLGEPDWGPDHIHCFVKQWCLWLESEIHLRIHPRICLCRNPPCMIFCASPGKMEFPRWRWLCELSSDPWCTVGRVILCCHASDSDFRYHIQSQWLSHNILLEC